jgi:hypothetical protein
MSPGQPVSDFSVSGTAVTVAGVAIDCAQREQDTAVHIEIQSVAGVATESLSDGVYLAMIDIPARRYETVVTPEGGDISGSEEGSISQLPVPLDPDAVTVTLWPTV